jgi:hypothetical protein
MTEWSLPRLLAGLHEEIEQRLRTAREAFGHPSSKGDASERVWLELLRAYLPARYRAEKAHVVDSEGIFSDEIDIVVFDRQYSPFIFNYEGQIVVPAESIYGVFEAKQTIDARQVDYGQKKVASVRRLHLTSLEIPYAGGRYPPKTPQHILGGVVTFESDWTPPLGEPLTEALCRGPVDGRLDLGCVAAHGTFVCNQEGSYIVTPRGRPAAAFLLELIARLQEGATVPMMDVRAYARWLSG